VAKRFGSYLAVESISFDMEPGEIVSLLGPSGCGKTTTLRIIAGFERQTSGQVYLGSEEVTDRKVYERNIGLVFQDYALFPHMTVFENVAYGLRQRRWDKKDITRRAGEMLELVRLESKANNKPSQLSGGQQQRVALARALATKPVVMLLDEPLSALDAKLREELRNDLKSILRAAGTATVIVTHDQTEAMGMSDRIIVMARGKVVQQGTPDEIYNAPNSRYVAEFVGRANIFSPAGAAQLVDGAWQLPLSGGLSVSVSASKAEVDGCKGVCVRAERIKIVSLEDAGAGSLKSEFQNVFAATVKDVTPLGGETEIRILVDGGLEVLAVQHSKAGRMVKPGEKIIAMFSPRDCVLIAR
jgi:putative spermidine/putrescine transport system ATP-binding protein/putrescine transport system ATP-binding protein